MHHYTSQICPPKLHSCILLVRASKFVFANVGSIGPTLALEAANGRLSTQEAALLPGFCTVCPKA